MRKFLIIPGLPRCATTSFSQILGQHPQIFLPMIKEPHFFLPGKSKYFMFNRKGDKIPFNKCGFVSTQKEFDENYGNFSTDQVYIDGSTLYACHPEAIDEIYKKKNIDPYFVILKRDPFKRAVSHYLYSVSRGEEFRNFDQALIDEKDGLYKNWLLRGYLAGSDSAPCEEKITSLWSVSKLTTANIDTDNVFSQAFMDKILSDLKLDSFTFNFNEMANALTYTENRVVREIRIFLKRVRQLNPVLIDNKFTRRIFNSFMRAVPVKKDVYDEYMVYENLFNELYNDRVAK